MSKATGSVPRALLREFLELNRRLPAEQAKQNLAQLRDRARQVRDTADAAAQVDALKELVAKTSFLRIMAPRRAGDRTVTATTYIVRDGKVVEGEADRPGLR